MDKIKASQFADLAYYSRFVPPSRLVTFAAPASTLTNYPALVKCNSTFNIGTSTGYDVHFQDLSGNELSYELDFYDPVTGNGAWWVQIPSLPSSGPTTVKMLYGDSSITTDGSSPTTVWSGYSAVYHFNSTNTTSQFNSATGTNGTWSEAEGGNAAKTCTFTSGGATGRMLSVYQKFGWNQTSVLNCACPNATVNTLNVTSIMEATDYFGSMNAEKAAHIGTMAGQYRNQSALTLYAHQNFFRQTPFTNGTLEYSSCSWRQSDKAVSWQINGTLETGTKETSWVQATSTVACLYTYRQSGSWTTYKVDEVRVRVGFASADYTAYEYNQLMNHATYTTYGPET